MKKKVAEFSQGAVYAYTIQNEAIHMTALNFGAVITELKTCLLYTSDAADE